MGRSASEAVSSRRPSRRDLVEGVDDDAADAVLEGGRPARPSDLLLPWRTSRSAGTPADERHVELAARRHIEVHALLVGQAGHGTAEEGLGGVGDPVAPGRHRLSAGVAQMVLVVDEERRADTVRQLEKVDATDVEVALLVRRSPSAGGGAAPAARWRRRGPSAWRCRIRQLRGPRERSDGRRASTIVPCSVSRPRSSADRAPASGAGGAGSSPAGGALYFQRVKGCHLTARPSNLDSWIRATRARRGVPSQGHGCCRRCVSGSARRDNLSTPAVTVHSSRGVGDPPRRHRSLPVELPLQSFICFLEIQDHVDAGQVEAISKSSAITRSRSRSFSL